MPFLRPTLRTVHRTRLFSTRSRLFDARTTPPPSPIAPRAAKPPPKTRRNQLPVYSLLAIFAFGTVAFNVLIQQRAGQTPANTYELPDRAPASKDQWPHPSRQQQKENSK